MKNVMAVDVRFGRVKALSAERPLEFPSVVGPWREIRFKNEVASSSFLEQLAVEYVGQKLFLGEMAYLGYMEYASGTATIDHACDGARRCYCGLRGAQPRSQAPIQRAKYAVRFLH